MPANSTWVERYEFDNITRRPTGFGVAQMVVTHPLHGAITVDLTRDELRDVAMQALAAMEPASSIDPTCGECGWEQSHTRHHDPNLYNFHPFASGSRADGGES